MSHIPVLCRCHVPSSVSVVNNDSLSVFEQGPYSLISLMSVFCRSLVRAASLLLSLTQK